MSRGLRVQRRRGIRRKLSQVQFEALGQDGRGNVLDAFHQLDQRVSLARAGTGAKPTPQLPITAVVTPCQAEGGEVAVPDGLAVVMGVDVDEARRDEPALGVDLLAPRAASRADGGDPAAGDGDIGVEGRRRCRPPPCRRG